MPDREEDPCDCAFCTGLVEKLGDDMIFIPADLAIGWATLALCSLVALTGWDHGFSDARMAQYKRMGEAAESLIEQMILKAGHVSHNNPDGRWN